MNMIVMLMGLLLTLFACAPVWATLGGGTNIHNHSSAASGGGTLNLTGTLSSTKACASGYTRVTPNYCKADNYLNLVLNNPGTGVCTQTTALTGVSGAKAVNFLAVFSLTANNTANTTRSILLSYKSPTDTTCAGVSQNASVLTVREQVATVAGSILAEVNQSRIVRTNVNGQLYAIVDANSGGPSTLIGLYVIGYFD